MNAEVRRIIGYVGVPTVDGRMIESYTTRGDYLPVINPWPIFCHRFFGMMTEIQTEPDGAITAIFAPDVSGLLVPEIDFGKCDAREENGIMVMSGELVAATLGTKPCWPNVGKVWNEH